jgi:acetylornithine/succinyldiaminopimelate/putrescine aminotransferase
MNHIIHPKIIEINGYKYQVTSLCKLSDTQALNAVIFFIRNCKAKKNKNKIITIVTSYHEGNVLMLGE